MRDLLLALFVLLLSLQLAFAGILFPFHGWITSACGIAWGAWAIGAKLWLLWKRPPTVEDRLDGQELKQRVLELQVHQLELKDIFIMATQAGIVDTLNKVAEQVKKVGVEIGTLKADVASLQAVIAAGPVTPELQAAVDKVAAQVQIVDDMVPDAAPAPDATPPA